MNHLVDLNETATKKDRFYAMASKAELIDKIAKAKFEEPPYHMRFLKSWTTRKEKDNERNGI